jgi:hypothetical protein
MAELPFGTVTFLSIDLEGSSRLGEHTHAKREVSARDSRLRDGTDSRRNAQVHTFDADVSEGLT